MRSSIYKFFSWKPITWTILCWKLFTQVWSHQ